MRAGRERRERCDSDAERETFEELVEDHSYKKGCCMERKVSTLSRQRRRNIPNSDPDMTARVSPMTNKWTMMPSCRTCVYASAAQLDDDDEEKKRTSIPMHLPLLSNPDFLFGVTILHIPCQSTTRALTSLVKYL